ncbi:telomerase reverse transcriptase [Phlyctema vagabunda]|uniref:Telomerase reverse transcriptase n=1 Tax=Phlyctema vagabunda TaxID=108571 RepID=A0ABR4P3W6_9HELO
MPGTRKRNRPGGGTQGTNKRQRLSGTLKSQEPMVKHAVLAQYYHNVCTLREYLLSKLPQSSKIRRRKIVTAGRNDALHPEDEADMNGPQKGSALASLLDQTLVGVSKYEEASSEERVKQWSTFSQRGDISTSTFGNNSSAGGSSQSEIVDFSIWLLFSKTHGGGGKVQHLLCQGFRRNISARSVYQDENLTSAIPGVVSVYPNSHVTVLKASPWPQLLALMGKEGERMMIDLILDCGVFVHVGSGFGTYSQLSGLPLNDLPLLADVHKRREVAPSAALPSKKALHSPRSITFVRNRMLYARATFNACGGVRFGLRHIHVLNRCPFQNNKRTDTGEYKQPPTEDGIDKPQPNTVTVMMYIFPRQFGLHNAFNSDVNRSETVQPLKDYTLREDEIKVKYIHEKPKIPRRLRGKVVELVKKLQILHGRCPYKKLLEYYCPIESRASRPSQITIDDSDSSDTTLLKTQASLNVETHRSILPPKYSIPERKQSMMDHATPSSMVSAFCRAVLRDIIPHQFWGDGEVQRDNERSFYKYVHEFIELRRFESLTLHQVMQGIKIANIPWLSPPRCAEKASQSDFQKRVEIFQEFVYYLFDSILIPLIRANFHVTESNVHRHRLFYFRHDVWRSLAEPALSSLKLSMLEEVKLVQAHQILNGRSLGFSQIRLLPKETGVRPIMNLRRRPLRKGTKAFLGSSINSILAPVYHTFNLEKNLHPERLGSTMFSVGDMYQKLKTFKSQLHGSNKPLYFAKLDVQSAFDTIPQDPVIALMASLPSETEYRIAKHVEIKAGDAFEQNSQNYSKSKPTRKWVSLAKTPDDFESFDENLENDVAIGKKNTIFVENVVNQFKNRDELLHLLVEHIHHNMVKIGKKFYRQKQGIPQGSVLSSLLCNYFYADLEAKHLDFLQSGDSLLLRLIDDFLLITTDRRKAKRFLQVMHDGVPTYGVKVNPSKTLTNFEATINGAKVARLVESRNFPYCGSFIDTTSLNISKDRERRPDGAMADALTVEFSKLPGRSFTRKVLAAFKMQTHAMFLDTAHNTRTTVLRNLHAACIDTATRMWTYGRLVRITSRVVIRTIADLVDLAFVLTQSKGRQRKRQNAGYACAVTRPQLRWLVLDAFRHVLVRRQSRYGTVLEWIDGRLRELRLGAGVGGGRGRGKSGKSGRREEDIKMCQRLVDVVERDVGLG